MHPRPPVLSIFLPRSALSLPSAFTALALAITLAVVPALTPTPAAVPTRAAGPPNLVLITTDDQTTGDLKYMPFTRRLIAREGVQFTNAISPFPLCCPARASLLTGLTAHNHGVLGNHAPTGGYPRIRLIERRTLPVWLRAAGYRTTFSGKYLNGYGSHRRREIPAGWADWHGVVAGVYDYFGNVVNDNGVVRKRAGIYQPELTQRDTARAIRVGAKTGRPFFIWQSNVAPHGACRRGPESACQWSDPMVARRDRTRFRSVALDTRRDPSFNERAVEDKPRYVRREPRWGSARIAQATRLHRARLQSLQAVDRNVRNTVALLSRTGELDNTLIVFASDNGFLNGQHRTFGKILPYEPSLKVPLLVRGPGVPRGRTVRAAVSLVDVAVTFADAANLRGLPPLDGRSLLPRARGAAGYRALGIEAAGVQGTPVGEWFYTGVRTRRYTYVEYPVRREAELYDRRTDPAQLRNVVDRPSYTATRRALERLVDRLRECEGAACRRAGGVVPAPRTR